jgi:hypothetical protein
MVKTFNRLALWVILCLGVGCAADPKILHTPVLRTPTTTVATWTSLAFQPTSAAVSTYPATLVPTLTFTSPPTPSPIPTRVSSVPDQTPTRISFPSLSPTPTRIPSPTIRPVYTPPYTSSSILAPSEDVTVFFVRSVFTDSVEPRRAEETSEIWRIQADGSNKQKLLAEKLEPNWLVGFGAPELSHNRQLLAFTESIDLWPTSIWSSSLWLMNVDGSDLRGLVSISDVKPGSPEWSDEDLAAFNTKPKPLSPAWSPDDSKIAFVDFDHYAPSAVCVLEVESGQWRKVGEGEVFAWSPGGSGLAIRSNQAVAATHALRVIDLNGQVRASVDLPSSAFLLSLDWSVAADLIVALDIGWNGGVYRIYVIDPESGHKEVVVEDTYEKYKAVGYDPQWSPNGKMISFARMNRDVRELYVLRLDTRDIQIVASQVGPTSVWSPDSRFILTQSNIEGNGVYIISVSDGQYWKIPNLDGDTEGVAFTSYSWLFPLQ